MILHGHTTIELKNVKNGKRERIEHDNEFTGALDEYVKTNGIWQMSPWNNDTWASVPIYQRLLGGVYIFKNTISKVNNKYPHFMPAGNEMIANGSFGVGNATEVTELGTYSTVESYFTNNSMTFVYDWTTGQGNGTFQCVCLGSDVGGYIGYGNKTSNKAHPTLKNMLVNQSPKRYDMIYKDGYDGFLSGYTFSGASLTMNRVLDINDTSVDLFPSAVSDLTITVPTDKIPSDWEKTFYYIKDGIYAVMPKNFTGGNSYNIGIYDSSKPAGYEWTWHEFDYSSSSGLISLETGTEISENGISHNEGANKRFFIKFNADPEQDTEPINFGTNDILTALFEFAPNLWIADGYIFDGSNNTITRCNGSKPNISVYRGSHALDDNILVENQAGNYTGFAQYHNPMYLATVNNLQSAITKDQNTAMKLTYTVTREA